MKVEFTVRVPLPTLITIMGKASLLLALRSIRGNGAVHSVQASDRRTLWLMLVASKSDEIALSATSLWLPFHSLLSCLLSVRPYEVLFIGSSARKGSIVHGLCGGFTAL